MKKIRLILLCTTPVLFFFGMRFMRMIFSTEGSESLKSEIIGAIIVGYGASLGLWYLDRKNRKEKDSK
jgi:hypothetical protein